MLGTVLSTACAGRHRDAAPFHPGTLSGAQAAALGARIQAGETPELIPATLPARAVAKRAVSERMRAVQELTHDFNAGLATLAERNTSPHAAGIGDLSGVWVSGEGLRYTIAAIPNGYSIVEEGELLPTLPPLAMAAGAGTYDGTVLHFEYNTLAGTSGHCALRLDRTNHTLHGAFMDPATNTNQPVTLHRAASAS
jgi:hypothetical protein